MATVKKVYMIKKYFNSVRDVKSRDNRIKKDISSFMTYNTEFLSSNGFPQTRVIFPANIRADMRDVYVPDEEAFKQLINNHPIIRPNFEIVSNPINLGLVVSYINTGDEVFLMMFCLKEYTSKLFKYFRLGVDQERMNYLIDNVLSYKYLVKRYGNIADVLAHTLDTTLQLFDDKSGIKTYEDNAIIELINSMSSRINSLIKNIATIYYEDDEQKRKRLVKDSAGEEGLEDITTGTAEIQNIINNTIDLAILDRYRREIYKMVDKNTKYEAEMIALFDTNIDLMVNVLKETMDIYVSIKHEVSFKSFKRDFLVTMFKTREKNEFIENDLPEWFKSTYKHTSSSKIKAFQKDVQMYAILYLYRVAITTR